MEAVGGLGEGGERGGGGRKEGVEEDLKMTTASERERE